MTSVDEQLISVQQVVELPNGEQCILDSKTLASQLTGGPPTIRLHSEIDSDLASCLVQGKPGITKQIERVKQIQGVSQPCELYTRNWFDNNMFKSKGTHNFKILQFNILAQGLSSGPHIVPPFPVTEVDTKGCFGGFSGIPKPEVSLDWNLRKWRLLEEIAGGSRTIMNGEIIPDLVALEECDNFENFFHPALGLYGFEAAFNPKSKAPGVPLGWYSDGCALFWRSSVFERVELCYGQYSGSSQGYLIAMLRHKESGKLMMCAVTHLKSKENTENEELRTRQMTELLQKMTEIGLEYNGEEYATILMGDFNTDPGNTQKIKATCVPLLTNNTNLTSAYPLRTNSSDYTTWKIRGEKETKHVIDYIFYEGFQCQSLLSIPTDEEVEPSRFPGFRYPSDHVAIGAEFSF